MKIGQKAVLEFLTLLNQLEPVEMAAISKILCVKLAGENGETKEGKVIVEEIVRSFSLLGRKQRRELIKVMRQAAKCKDKVVGDEDGTSTEHSEES